MLCINTRLYWTHGPRRSQGRNRCGRASGRTRPSRSGNRTGLFRCRRQRRQSNGSAGRRSYVSARISVRRLYVRGEYLRRHRSYGRGVPDRLCRADPAVERHYQRGLCRGGGRFGKSAVVFRLVCRGAGGNGKAGTDRDVYNVHPGGIDRDPPQ